MKIGILGTGMMAGLLMPVIKKLNFEYVAVLGRRESRRKSGPCAGKTDLTNIFWTMRNCSAVM